MLSLSLTIMICCGVRPNGSLLTTGSLLVYAAYLQWSAMASLNNTEYNLILKNNRFNIEMIVEIVVNVILALISIVYMSF